MKINKIEWPTSDKAMANFGIVLFAIITLAIFFWAVDTAITVVMTNLF